MAKPETPKKPKLIWIEALKVLQKPDRSWASVGDVFQIMDDMVSKRAGVMRKLTDKEVKKHLAGLEGGAAEDAKDARISELEKELEDAALGRDVGFAAADALQCELGEVLDRLAEMQKPPADPGNTSAIAGQSK